MWFYRFGNNSIYSKIFFSFFRFTAIFIFVILFGAFLIVNHITIHTRSSLSVSQVENHSNNVTNMINSAVTICNSFAENEPLIQDLRDFYSGGISQKVDLDNEITQLLKATITHMKKFLIYAFSCQSRKSLTL